MGLNARARQMRGKTACLVGTESLVQVTGHSIRHYCLDNMNGFAIIFVVLNSILLLSLPRQYAPIPLLIAVSYMTIAQGIDIGPFNFTVIRILVAVGVIRVIVLSEWKTIEAHGLDFLMIAFAIWAIASSFFRPEITSSLVFRLGLAYNTCGVYFLLRFFCQSTKDIWGLYQITAILLAPIAIAMMYEQIRVYNVFSLLGGVPAFPTIREGNIRAQGPFRHAILAGTVGAVCFPLMASLWFKHRKSGIIGMVSCLIIVLTSKSSGPLASLIAGLCGLLMWRYRHNMRYVRWSAFFGIIALDFIMKAPVYFLMARIPLVKGSTGWHRAELIDSSIRHLNEWWLWGTDYTRHWMPTGVSWSPDHTDITNHYIKMGVIGGMPLMVLLISQLVKAFFVVGKVLQSNLLLSPDTMFMVWALGASLFANAATMISVSYFDQSFVFLYMTLAAIGSVWSSTIKGYGENPILQLLAKLKQRI